jgi:tetratricopeptide (TPR) repeat protein
MCRVLALIALLMTAAPAAAQGVTSPYLDLVWRYRAGDTLGALTDLAALPTDGLRARVLRDLGPHVCEKAAGLRDCHELRRRQPGVYRQRVAPLLKTALPAAVLLHLHASTALDASGTRDAGKAHRSLARILLDRMGEVEGDLDPPVAARFREQRRRAHLLIVWLLQSDSVDAVDAHLPDVRRAFPDDTDLLLASGWVDEMRARPMFLRSRLSLIQPTTTVDGGARWLDRERTFRLTRAATFYRQSLAARPSQAEARVRLGRVLFLQNRLDDARTVLAEIDASVEPRFRYLATMFGAAIEEQAQRAPAARRAYEAAMKLWPASQAARIGLGRLLARDGDRAGAAALVAALPTEPPPLDQAADPWAWYYLGQAWRIEPSFLALRADLRK